MGPRAAAPLCCDEPSNPHRSPSPQSHLSKPVMGVRVEYLMSKYGWTDSVDFIKMVS